MGTNGTEHNRDITRDPVLFCLGRGFTRSKLETLDGRAPSLRPATGRRRLV